jgi:alkylation response protein AidB-like acyl-CoA dehydrogenase
VHDRVCESDEEFRARARDWLASNVPAEPQPADGPALREFDLAWQRRQFEGGWAGISWPVKSGGLGLSPVRQLIWHEEYARARAPYISSLFVGQSDAGPTLIECGSPSQQEQWLAPILRGEAIWCQGYSEPGAGSDIAAITTQGKIVGDRLIVNGEKIWTSYGDLADLQELLVRTDPDSTRHHGLTWVVCDMSSPGISVEPLRLLTGERHFCRVRYENVAIPLSNVVGEVGGGWAVLMASLTLKRGPGRFADVLRLESWIDDLCDTLRQNTARKLGPDTVEMALGRLAEARSQVVATRAMAYAQSMSQSRYAANPASGSLIRVLNAELTQAVLSLAADVLGEELAEPVRRGRVDWLHDYLWSLTDSIGGGTTEIQRNVIAERLLGLPR